MIPRLAIALSLFACGLTAQSPPLSGTLVKDIHTGPPALARDSDPALLASSPTRAWFTAEDRTHGREIWTTDGTTAGTGLLADLEPGTDSTRVQGGVVLPNGRFVVLASSATTGLEPFVSDPASPGLQLLADLNPGPGGCSPSEPVLWRGEAWFAARTPTHGLELWRSDGTVAGTRIGQELVGGPGSIPIDPTRIAVAGNQLYFLAGSPFYFVWVKPAPNQPAFVLRPYQTSLRTRGWFATELGNSLMFPGEDGIHGIEPWITDGTVAGTQRLADLAPGLADTFVRVLASNGQRAWFLAETPALGRELYVTDGTPAGTRLVVDLNPGPNHGLNYQSSATILPNGDLLFGAFGGAAGEEVWRTDGTPAGTRLAADLNPGSASSVPTGFLSAGNRAYFSGRTADFKTTLWTYDSATGLTTQLATPARVSGQTLGIRPLSTLGTDVLFAGADPRFGLEPRLTDGTAPNTRLVRDIHEDPTGDGRPEGLFRHRELLFFQADDGVSSFEPWVTDGTPQGTVQLGDLAPGLDSSLPTAMATLPAGLLFRARTGANLSDEVWVTEGTPASTRRLIGFGTSTRRGEISSFQAVGDVALFVSQVDGRTSLWRSDGTVRGTTPVSGWSNDPDLFLALEATDSRRVFGVGSNAATGPARELFVSDGTTAGTQIVDLFPGPGGSFPTHFTAAADGVVFTPFEPVDGVELWFAGGDTPFRLQRLTNSAPGRDGFRIVEIASQGSTAVFLATDPVMLDRRVFWRTDGTPAGTVQISSSLPRTVTARAFGLTAAGPLVWFWTLPSPSGSYELWATDGTAPGFRKVWNAPIDSALFPQPEITALGDGASIAFTLWEPTSGRELWFSDGSTAGTRLLTDIAPGSEDADPSQLTRLGNRILFAASDTRTGLELHAIDHADLGAFVASPFGRGCGASIETSGSPTLGDSFSIDASFTASGSASAFLFSRAAAWAPLAGNRCVLHLAQPDSLAAVTTDAAGNASLSFTVPNLPALVGDLLFFQAFAATAGGPLFGAVSGTPGLEVVVGR